MISLRLVLDTNILISAILLPEGLQRTVLTLAINRPSHWYTSKAIIEEYSTVLARPKFRIPKGLRNSTLEMVRRHSREIASPRLPLVTADPDDNIFIECADAARADYLVTGNLRHFPPYWKSTKIISTRAFLSLVSPHLLP